jgi:hypothetical protein
MNAAEMNAGHEVVAQLEALANDLDGRGFAARVTRSSDALYVTVVSRSVAQMREDVYAVPVPDGTWWLCWSWGDRISPVSEVATAAFKIAYVLTTYAND